MLDRASLGEKILLGLTKQNPFRLTVLNSDKVSITSQTCFHHKAIGICTSRALFSIKSGISLNKNEKYDIAEVPEEYRPGYMHTLNASISIPVHAAIVINAKNSGANKGKIQIIPIETLEAAGTVTIRLVSWWYTFDSELNWQRQMANNAVISEILNAESDFSAGGGA